METLLQAQERAATEQEIRRLIDERHRLNKEFETVTTKLRLAQYRLRKLDE